MGAVQRFFENLSEYVGIGAAFLILPLLFVVTYEVIARYGFNAPTVWAFEATTLLYGVHFVLSFAYTHKHDGHVAIDVIEAMLPTKVRVWIRLFANLALFLPTTGLISIWAVIYSSDSWRNWELASTSWAPPLYPFKTLMAVGFTLLFLQGVAKLIRDIQLLGQLNTQHTAGNAENQS